MAMDALFGYADAVIVLVLGREGAVAGFLQLVPSPACRGYSLAAMRRLPGGPNGLMEFAIVRTIEWARAEEVNEVSLNFSVFAEYLRADGTLLRTLLIKTDRLFQLERLHSFNRKFFPEWRRRYFCFERWTELPLAALAYPARRIAADPARPVGEPRPRHRGAVGAVHLRPAAPALAGPKRCWSLAAGPRWRQAATRCAADAPAGPDVRVRRRRASGATR